MGRNKWDANWKIIILTSEIYIFLISLEMNDYLYLAFRYYDINNNKIVKYYHKNIIKPTPR